MAEGSDRLIAVTLDESGMPAPSPETEQERRVAIFDLVDSNRFGVAGATGPFRLHLAVRERRLVFEVATATGDPVTEFHVSLTPFNQVVKDYFAICASYFDAVRRLPAAQIEALDAGRREIHDEGSRQLLERLQGKVEIDLATARRLFTLLCALKG